MALNLITLKLSNAHEIHEINFPIELLPIIRCGEIIQIDEIKFKVACVENAVKIDLSTPKKPIITLSGDFIK